VLLLQLQRRESGDAPHGRRPEKSGRPRRQLALSIAHGTAAGREGRSNSGRFSQEQDRRRQASADTGEILRGVSADHSSNRVERGASCPANGATAAWVPGIRSTSQAGGRPGGPQEPASHWLCRGEPRSPATSLQYPVALGQGTTVEVRMGSPS